MSTTPLPTTALALAESPPSPLTPPLSGSGLNFNDLLFIFYRHKLKISLFILIGLAAAAGIFFLLPATTSESQAKLLVRYVVERSAVDGIGGEVSGTNKGEAPPPVGAPSE